MHDHVPLTNIFRVIILNALSGLILLSRLILLCENDITFIKVAYVSLNDTRLVPALF